jgi:hypothetical protein
VFDVGAYRFVTVFFSAASTGGWTWQTSNDGVTWINTALERADGAQSSLSVSIGNSGFASSVWAGALTGRYFRITNTSGTVAGTVLFAAAGNGKAVFIQNSTVAVGGPGSISDAAGDSSASLVAYKGYGYNGASWDRLRTPTKFFTATATASGDTALWTPTSGKKFRLLRYQIQITGDAATSGGADIDIVLRDSTTALAAAYSLYVPAASVNALGADNTGWQDLGNGILSAAANNVLNINLSAALTSGKVRVVCAGTEE